jgi:hypothetical protein
MAKKYGSVDFPFQQDQLTQALKRTTDVNKTIVVALQCFLLTEPGQRRGNAVGSILGSLRQKTLTSNALKGLADELKKELSDHFPGVIIIDVNLSKDFEDQQSNLICKVAFQTPISQIEELTVLI